MPTPGPPPGMPAGRGGFDVLPSPDGGALLVTIDRCELCNKPSDVPTTTYLVRDGVWTELGVDVAASWAGAEPQVAPRPPELGYSGYDWQIFERRDDGAAYVPSPFRYDMQVGGTDRVQWRVYDLSGQPGDPPRHIMPAFNTQTAYNSWQLWWPDVPAEPVRLELWAEVRPGAPDDPSFIREGDTRWAVVWRDTVRRDPDQATAQTISLRDVWMEGTDAGWGVDASGRIVRTSDGGSTWRDVTPPGHARCDGRLWPRQAEHFAGDVAIVALTCDRTGSDGRWSDWPQRITVFTTADGGLSWLEATIDTGYRFARPASLHAADGGLWLLAQPVWPAHNHNGALWHSADGGATWTRIADTDGTLPAARGLTFVTAQRGWALGRLDARPAGAGRADAGSPGTTSAPVAAHAATGSTLWRPLGSTLWRTDDGGRTWTEQPLPVPADAYAVQPPQFLDDAVGFFAVHVPDPDPSHNPRQLLLATDDGGMTWSVRGERRGDGQPHFLTPAVGYVWDYPSRELAWTHDGARTWEAVPAPEGVYWPFRLQFVDAWHGFVAQSTLLTTADGGRTWREILPQWFR